MFVKVRSWFNEPKLKLKTEFPELSGFSKNIETESST